MKRLNQAGSHVVAIGLVVLVLGVVGFAGYTVSQHNKKPDTTAATLAAPKTILTKTDLNETAQSLDDVSADLNSSVDGSTLDSSIDDLL
jgi:hypothetical protein